jgi:hypothetical protein
MIQDMEYLLTGTDVANRCGMKDKSFENAMNKIAMQAEALQLKEAKEAQRQRTIGHIKKACFMLAFIAVAVVVFSHRDQIQEAYLAKVSPAKSKLGKFGTNGGTNYQNGTIAGTLDSTENKVNNSLMAAAANAQIRDSIIDQVAK